MKDRLARMGSRVSTRGVVSVAVIGSLVAVCAGVVAALALGWGYGLAIRDPGVRAGVIVAVASLALVMLGAVVALAAYRAATGAPDLFVVVQFRYSEENEPVFQVDSRPAEGFEQQVIVPYRQVEGDVRLINRSRYSARNPGVRIELNGLHSLPEQSGWAVLGRANMAGIVAIQWDGGMDQMVHGHWVRTLPALRFGEGVWGWEGQDHALIVTVAADGLAPRKVRMPVRLLKAVEYGDYSSKRAAQLANERDSRRKAEPASGLHTDRES